MEKKRVIKNMENLTDDIFEVLKQKYPDGWSNHIIKVNRGNNQFFHAITVDTDDTSYLIRVNVKIDSNPDFEKMEKDPEIDENDLDKQEDVSDSNDYDD